MTTEQLDRLHGIVRDLRLRGLYLGGLAEAFHEVGNEKMAEKLFVQADGLCRQSEALHCLTGEIVGDLVQNADKASRAIFETAIAVLARGESRP